MISLTKKELDSLKKLRNNPSPQESIYNFETMLSYNLIEPVYTSEIDAFGAFIPDGTYQLTEEYDRYTETNRWFNLEYVVSHLIVPVAVSVLATFITIHFLT